MTARRGFAALLVPLLLLFALLATATPATAEPDDPAYEPGAIRSEMGEALLRGDREAAVAAADRVLAAEPVIRERDVETARAVIEMFPPRVGSARAVTLLLRALRADRSAAGGAWALTQELRKRLLRRIDLDEGGRLLAGLLEVYPDELSYRRDLALLQLDGGNTAAARREFETLLHAAPSDVDTLYRLALIEEQLGELESARQRYASIIDTTGDLTAHHYLTRLLIYPVRDFDAARQAIERGLAAARDAPVGASREEYLEVFEQERGRLEVAVGERDRLLAMDARLNRLLWSVAGGWMLVLGGGVFFLRRRGLL